MRRKKAQRGVNDYFDDSGELQYKIEESGELAKQVTQQITG